MAALVSSMWAGKHRQPRDSTQSSVDFHSIGSSNESVDDLELSDLSSESDDEENQPGTSAATNRKVQISLSGLFWVLHSHNTT